LSKLPPDSFSFFVFGLSSFKFTLYTNYFGLEKSLWRWPVSTSQRYFWMIVFASWILEFLHGVGDFDFEFIFWRILKIWLLK
jgi:hypothetical protein